MNHRKKVNDDPQKEKRWTLLKKDRLRRRFAQNSFTFLQIQVWPGKKSGAPNENITQNHLNIALLNVF